MPSASQMASKARSAAVSTLVSRPPFKKKKTVTGRVIVIQEERFRLRREDGQVMLLRLSRSANVDPLELCRFHEADRKVEVQYSGDPNLSNAVAETVRPV